MNSRTSLSSTRGVLLLFAAFAVSLLGVIAVEAQSTDQLNPTPVTGNQINGEIRARDLGDSRDTRYYYLFSGNRGDVFINVVTQNINGSIDIFTLNGLSPRTKITLFADNSDTETGRIVYMRESEMLILRVQGRTPNDDPGTYQIKFAGSFAPATGIADSVDKPEVDENDTGTVRVNTVGTIIEEPPAPKVSDKVTADAVKTDDLAADKDPDLNEPVDKEEPAANPAVKKAVADIEARPKPVVVIDDPLADIAGDTSESGDEKAASKEVTVSINRSKAKRSALVTIERAKPEADAGGDTNAEPTLEEKLAKVQLIVALKNGDSFSRPMNEVLSVNVIRGVLTIVTTDGKIQEFSILDVLKMSIE